METILKKYRRKTRRIGRFSELILIALTLSSLVKTEHVRSHQSKSTYLVPLTDTTLQLLENEMQRLLLSGYDWDHSYTQCVIKQILLTRRIANSYDPGLCSRVLRLTQPYIPLEATIDLSMKTKPQDMAMIEFTPDSDSDFAREVFLPIADNRVTHRNDGNDGNDGNDANDGNDGYGVSDGNGKDVDNDITDNDEYQYKNSKRSYLNDKVISDLNKLLEDSNESENNDQNLPLFETEFTPDLNQIPVYSERDVQWNDDTDSNEQNEQMEENVENEFESENDDNINSFPRQPRYDIKKPGPGWGSHEPDSSEKQSDYTLQPQAIVDELSNEAIKADVKPNFVTKAEQVPNQLTQASTHRLTNLTLTLCGLILAALVSSAIVFLYKRNEKFRQKLHGFASRPDIEASQDYQDLCRQRMQNKSNEKAEPIQVAPTTVTGIHSTTTSKLVSKLSHQSSDAQPSSSSRSSTSSWSEEPVSSNMDISTGHMILSYMEDHLKKKDRLDREWEALCAYEADPCSTNAANLQQNIKKNRYPDILPYDHSRVILNDLANINGSDYINADTITDHDPRNPAYIATQAPLPHTTADFWQMVWEQGSVIIVMLTRLRENGVAMCQRYWPEEGSEVYHTYEVHLVSEHIWCDDYLVRSFYLKNLKSSETRTVTQFHFLSWPENGIPPNAKTILEFRRKVNKSYRGRSCPIVVHCSDGSGRTGTYTLIDMVLNRMSKGAKEIDIAATLEHIRDQRMGTVKTKAQFEYVLTAVAEEVQAILKALRQN